MTRQGEMSYPRHKRNRWLALGLGGLVLLLITACSNSGRPLTTLDPQGPESTKIQDLAGPVFIVAGVIFICVEFGVLFIVSRFRRRNTDVDGVDEPEQVHGNFRLEIVWTLIPTLILCGIAVFTAQTIFALEEVQEDALPVEVIGQQWWWEFRYDFDDDGEPDIISANQLVIPAGRQIDLSIRSNDVIHSFWIPALNGKKDAVPGRTHSLLIQANEPGVYEGQCTEFCGISHGYMQMQVRAVPAAEFEAWKQNQLAPPVEPTSSAELAGYEIFKAQCARCHQVNGIDTEAEGYSNTGPTPDPDYGADQVANNAPNLTHLMSRSTFAGSMFDLYADTGDGVCPVVSDSPTAEEQHSAGCTPNLVDLESWLRDPPAMKPMAPDGNRGMPNLGLSEEQVSALIAYLTILE
ncbi:MAG: cytochrome c oxidase subunit 2 [Acidimicrobiales bacterium]|nr:MAG: cytochrome c oxidase subunit II [Actinomycetota bacterium]MBV6507452.1 cytochrome c oxidase subunit 2 [Acidimicrobiales bacterium]RIK07832.1 MAG: cytochrome c oxidase subunit II [Acidobacteriota bacterium]